MSFAEWSMIYFATIARGEKVGKLRYENCGWAAYVDEELKAGVIEDLATGERFYHFAENPHDRTIYKGNENCIDLTVE